MKQTFDYLENAAFSATACDMEGSIVYQNALSIKRKGDVRGKSVFGCHKEKSNEIIRRMLKSGESYTYEIIIHGQHRLIQQMPWYEEDGGEMKGLLEVIIDLPEGYPTFDRDKEKQLKK